MPEKLDELLEKYFVGILKSNEKLKETGNSGRIAIETVKLVIRFLEYKELRRIPDHSNQNLLALLSILSTSSAHDNKTK